MTQNSQYEFIPAAFTPFSDEGTIDLPAIGKYANYLLREQLRCVFVNGTTGESLLLTVDERLQLAEAWFEHGRRGLRIMVHVGHDCIHEAERLAAHANQHGAEGIACMAPSFFLPRNVDELIDYLEPIAAAAPATDFYFYHLPSMTGVSLDMDEMIAKSAKRIPTFAGVKYTHEDLNEYQRCEARWRSKYRLLWGRDELLLPALSFHARGGVGSIYNLTPRAFAAVADSFFAGDRDRALHVSCQVNQFIEEIKKVGVIPAGKVLLAELGIGSGGARLPLKTLSDAERAQVLNAARAVPLDGDRWKSSHALGNLHIPLGDGAPKRVCAAS